jgi:rhamnulokinase
VNVLAFDLGGSGGKVLLGRYDGTNIHLESVHRFENSPILINSSLYWNIINIYQQMNIGIKKAISMTNDTIVSLGIDTFSNDFAFIDRTGELLSPVRCYRDNRTQKYKQETYKKISPETLYSLTGNQNALFNTLMQLSAMRQAGQGHILDNSYKMLFTPDLLINFLTGEFVSEYTISSVSQLYNFKDQNWCDIILDTFQIPKDMLGKLVQPGTIIGPTKEEYNKQLQTKGFQVIAVCEHDTASAFLASVNDRDCAIISSGTWALVGTEIPEPIITEQGLKYNIANEGGYPGRHRLLRNVMGSWLIQEIREYYKENNQEYSYAELEIFATEAKPFAYLIDVDDPMFFSPGNMPEKIRTYCLNHYKQAPQTIGALVRCVYESLAFKYRWTIEKLEHMILKPLASINVVGGGSKSNLMCQFTANACNKPVAAGPSEATALGNILVQLIANKQIADISEGKKIIRASFPTQEFLPEDILIWEKEYVKFKNLLKLN